ncbi:MAG: hypothetical protein AAF490_14800 [Chloroflexota bacterium]
MNDSKHSIENQIQISRIKAIRHWIQDGVAETIIGIYLLIFAALFLADFASGLAVSTFMLPVVLLGGIFLLSPFVRWIKGFVAVPRTGFVQLRETPLRQRWIALVGGLAFGFVIAFIGSRQIDQLGRVATQEGLSTIWLPLIQGVVLTLLLIGMGFYFHASRFYVVAIVSLFAGGFLMLVQLEDAIGTAVIFGIVGVTMIILGIGVMRQFMKNTPVYNDGVSWP